jgi:hypothetical protein
MASIKQRLEDAGARLCAAKSELAKAQEEWDALFERAVSGGRGTTKPVDFDDPDGSEEELDKFILENAPTAVNLIAGVLNSNTEKEWDYDEISGRLPTIPRASIRVVLYKLKEEKKAEKTGRGTWKALPARILNDENLILDVLNDQTGLGKSASQIADATGLLLPKVSEVLRRRPEMFIEGADHLWRKKR